MRGIEFSSCDSFYKLLEGFCLENYDWYIYEDEIISNQTQQETDVNVSAKSLRKLLFDKDVVIVFMNLQAFPKGAKACKIRNYNEFQLSECAFVVLVTDASFVEIYTRNDEDTLLFIKNAERCGGRNIIVKTEQEDARYSFSII